AAASLAERFGIAAPEWGAFFLDHARVVLEVEPETQISLECALRTRWQLRQSSSGMSPAQLVLGSFRPSPRSVPLSAGAHSICHLAEFLGWPADELTEGLSACE